MSIDTIACRPDIESAIPAFIAVPFFPNRIAARRSVPSNFRILPIRQEIITGIF
ncbi:hypothetical protein [Burkholderia multivorans]|uniref:hypothetical protein n=1 Tax=Burkholderia multivorans TaxID=87883 RepID=UPI0015E3356D|nr:hypothetical protein [Burkholderia multivorans]